MIVLGCDVGKTTGLAVIDCQWQRPKYLASFAVDHDLPRVLDAAIFGAYAIDVVAIETPTQVFEHGRARKSKGARIGIERALLASAPMVGVVRAVAALRAPEAAIHEGQAHVVRRAVLGALPRKGIDKFVGGWVPLLIEGWPKRSNDHERDAAIAALWGFHRARRTP